MYIYAYSGCVVNICIEIEYTYFTENIKCDTMFIRNLAFLGGYWWLEVCIGERRTLYDYNSIMTITTISVGGKSVYYEQPNQKKKSCVLLLHYKVSCYESTLERGQIPYNFSHM